jgi:uncharacterized protein YdhG (YjbR/CyaY superfamily)
MPFQDTDEYLADLPEDARAALETLRGMIKDAAPDAVEAISYGVPAFKHKGRPLVSYGAAKNHCAFYVMSPEVMQAHAAEIKGYEASKGTIRFPPDKPLPATLITLLVKARIAELEKS